MNECWTSSFGTIFYTKNDRYNLHREDGPAVIFTDGSYQYWLNDRLHRLDGPAVYTKNHNYIAYYIDGELIKCKNEEEFLRWVKMRTFW